MTFGGCEELTNVNYYAINCRRMGNSSNWVFYNCPNLVSLNIGNDVTNLPAYAFKGCSGITDISIPNAVSYIGDEAFSGSGSLSNVNFNATNCTYMGSEESPVFSNCTALMS
jgi:hypothetical protein